jgi:RNA polymerase sigma-70 factor (ECF subfamily)
MPLTSPDEVLDADSALAAQIARRDQAAFETLMRRHNGRLYRVARGILRNDADAEDALQDAYLDAFRHIDGFRGASTLITWLTRIVINRSLMRLRGDKRHAVVVPFAHARGEDSRDTPENEMEDARADSPADATLRAEMRRTLERRIDELPSVFRTVFIMREVEEMSADEVAECLGIPVATVRTRLFRARAQLRKSLSRDIDVATGDAFKFDGARCDRIVRNVLARAASD